MTAKLQRLATFTLAMDVPTSRAQRSMSSRLRLCEEVMPYSSKYCRSIVRCSGVKETGSEVCMRGLITVVAQTLVGIFYATIYGLFYIDATLLPLFKLKHT